jgi:hypothetical protein
MTFQFLCPQGHLLEGEEAHMGMQCQCPQCGTDFIIPTIEQPGQSGARGPADESSELGLAPLQPDVGYSEPVAAGPVDDGPVDDGPIAALDLSDVASSELGAAADAEQMLHIPCPNGHELETPLDMIGQRAACPHCGVEFRLRREKSIEYLHQQELIERRRARFWFQLAVMAASFVGFVLVVMLGIMIFSQ